MSYPRSLSYFLNHLNGLSKNTVKFYPQTPQVFVRNGDTIRVLLPQNTLVDLRTLIWNFNGSTATTGGFAAFPRHIETIIDGAYLEINNQPVQPSTKLNNQVFKILADYTMKDRESARFLQKGAGVVAPVANEAGTPYSVYNWLGFIGTALPEVIDTSMLGDCTLVIQLASNRVLLKSAACAGELYQLDNLNFQVDTLSLDDGGVYYDALEKRLSAGVLEIPFKYWVSFTGQAGNNKVTGTIDTQSLDVVIGTVLPANPGNANNRDAVTQTSDYFTRGDPNLTFSTVYVNNIKYPQFDYTVSDAYNHSLKALNLSQDTLGAQDDALNSLVNFRDRFFTHITRFNLATPSDERWVSGIDTRGTMAQVRFECNAGIVGCPHMFTECTGTLLVSGRRRIQAVW